MDEHLFIQTLNTKAKEIGINPLLLLSGVEGLYTFREVELNSINYEFLDSLILTIFALRIGDQFHSLAEENFRSANAKLVQAAAKELCILTTNEIAASSNHYLHSFAKIISGKTNIRIYHIKALEVAALEIRKAQIIFTNKSIGAIVMEIYKHHLGAHPDLGSIFQG